LRSRALIFVLALPAVSTAQSPPDIEKAKTFFTAGAQAFERGDFLGAIQAFERANELAPRPAILFSIAQAYRRQYYIDKKPESLKNAVANYRKYLEQAPDGNRRADAAQALAELGPAADRLGGAEGGPSPVKPATRVSVGSNAPNAFVSMDGAPPSPAPFIHDVAPGEHTFVVTAEGFVGKTEKLRVAEGDFAAKEVQLKEIPGKLFIKTDSGAQVLVDGRIVGSAPFGSPIDVEPGTRQIAITHNGYEPVVREIDIGRGETKSLDVSLSSTGQRRISRVLLGIGAGGIALGGVFLGVSFAAEQTAVHLRDKRMTMGLSAQEAVQYEGARNDRNTWLVASVVAAITGLGIGGTGLLLYLFDQPPLNLSAPKVDKKPEQKKNLDIGLSPNGVIVVGSF
jgi:hypothetical protein